MDDRTITASEAEALLNEALERVWVSRIAEKAEAGVLNLTNRDERVRQISDFIANAAGHKVRIEVAESVGVGSIGFNAVAYHRDNLVRVGEKMVDALTDDGLAMVIAHEVVHIRDSHGERKFEKRKDLTERFDKAFEEFSEKIKHEDRSFKNKLLSIVLVAIAAFTIIHLVLQGFSRFLETEADTRAVNIARKAGFDAEAGVGELVQVLREVGHIPSLAAIVLDHPSTKARERRMRKALEGKWPPERHW